MESKILIKPVVSEKSYNSATNDRKYIFFVDKSATKIDIEREVEKVYKVKVESVNIIVKPGKLKKDWRVNKSYRASDLKKAVVKLDEKSKIDDFFNI